MQPEVPAAFVAEVVTVLRQWETTPIGRIKRQPKRTISEELKTLGASDEDTVWMATAIVRAKGMLKNQEKLRTERDEAKRRSTSKGDAEAEVLSGITEGVLELMDIDKLADRVASIAIRALEANTEHGQKKREVNRLYQVRENHTKLPNNTLRRVARLLCGRLVTISKSPHYLLVGRMLTADGLMSDEGIPLDRQARLAGERVRKMVEAAKGATKKKATLRRKKNPAK